MTTVLIGEDVRIPHSVVDLDSFREWACSVEFPARGRFAFLDGEIWVDMSAEEVVTHNRVKGTFAVALDTLITKERLGWYLHDRTLLTNEGAGLSTEPDEMCASYSSIREGRVQLVKGVHGIKEVSGSPEVSLEVVSDGSVTKDKVTLRTLYWRAGVEEYWLVDARRSPARFDILRRGPSGFAPAPKRSGWIRSGV